MNVVPDAALAPVRARLRATVETALEMEHLLSECVTITKRYKPARAFAARRRSSIAKRVRGCITCRSGRPHKRHYVRRSPYVFLTR